MNQILSNKETFVDSETFVNNQIELLRKLSLDDKSEIEKETNKIMLDELKSKLSEDDFDKFKNGQIGSEKLVNKYGLGIDEKELVLMSSIILKSQNNNLLNNKSDQAEKNNIRSKVSEINEREPLSSVEYIEKDSIKGTLWYSYKKIIESPKENNVHMNLKNIVEESLSKKRESSYFIGNDFNFDGSQDSKNEIYLGSDSEQVYSFDIDNVLDNIFTETINDNYKKIGQILQKSSIDYEEFCKNAEEIKLIAENMGLFLFGNSDEVDKFLNIFDDLENPSWKDISKILKLNNKKKKWFLESKDFRKHLVNYINNNGTNNLDDKILKQTFKIIEFDSENEDILYETVSKKLSDKELMNNIDYSLLNNLKRFVKDIQNGKDSHRAYEDFVVDLTYRDLSFLPNYIDTILVNLGEEKILTNDNNEKTKLFLQTQTYMKYQKGIQESKILQASKKDLVDFTDILDLKPERHLELSKGDLNRKFKDKLLNRLVEYRKKGNKPKLAKFLSDSLFGKEGKKGIISELSEEYDFNEENIKNKLKDDPNIIEKFLKDIEYEQSNELIWKSILKGDNYKNIDTMYEKANGTIVTSLLQEGMNLEENEKEIKLKYLKDIYLKKMAFSDNTITISGGGKFSTKKKEFNLNDNQKELLKKWERNILEASSLKEIKDLTSKGNENYELIDQIIRQSVRSEIADKEEKDINNIKNVDIVVDHYKEKYFQSLNGFIETGNSSFRREMNYIESLDGYEKLRKEFVTNKTKKQEAIEYTNNQIKNKSSFYEDFSENLSKHQDQSNSESSKESNKDGVSNSRGNTGATSNFESKVGNKNYAVSKKKDKNGNTIGWSLKLGDKEDSEVIEVEKKENINDNVRIIEKLLERKGIDVDLVSKDRSKSMEASIFDKYKKIQDLSESPEKINFELIEGAIMQGIRKWVVDKVDNTKEYDLKVPPSTMSKIKSSQTNRSIEGLSEFFAKLKTTHKDWKDKNNMYYDAVSADDVGTSNGLIVMIEELENMNTIDEVYAMSNSSL